MTTENAETAVAETPPEVPRKARDMWRAVLIIALVALNSFFVVQPGEDQEVELSMFVMRDLHWIAPELALGAFDDLLQLLNVVCG